jgi:hypothetical protein
MFIFYRLIFFGFIHIFEVKISLQKKHQLIQIHLHYHNVNDSEQFLQINTD